MKEVYLGNLQGKESFKIIVMNNNIKIATALIAGVAIGAAAGVLLAPDKGSETRKKIKAKGQELANEMKNKFRQGKENINEMKEEIAQSIKEKTEEYA